MSEQGTSTVPASAVTATVILTEPTPEVIARLLDVVADHSIDHALSDIEQMLERLRADAAQAAEAREVLRTTPAAVLREALRLRAARTGSTGIEAAR